MPDGRDLNGRRSQIDNVDPTITASLRSGPRELACSIEPRSRLWNIGSAFTWILLRSAILSYHNDAPVILLSLYASSHHDSLAHTAVISDSCAASGKSLAQRYLGWGSLQEFGRIDQT